MRYLLSALLLAVSVTTFAHEANDGNTGLKVGKCYPAYPSGYIVRKKLDKNVYELTGNWMSPHALLKTTMISENAMATLRRMGPLNIDLKFMGTKIMEMDSGFKAPVDLWEECTGKENLKQVNTPLGNANTKHKSIEREAETDATKKFNKCTDDCHSKFTNDKDGANKCYESCSSSEGDSK